MSPAPAVEQPSVYQALFAASSEGGLVVDRDGVIQTANVAAERLLGYPTGALVGLCVDSLVPSRFGSHVARRHRFTAEPTARPMGRGLELSVRRADGRELPVDISLTPVTVDGQLLIGCVLRELSDRPAASENLRVQATALRAAANGIVITDRTGIIVWVNPAACQITGYANEELLGSHTRLLKSGEHDREFYRALWSTVQRGETWSGTIVNRRRDGSLYHEEQTIAPVTDDEGEITHYIAIKQDVTEQRRVLRVLGELHLELATRVTEIEELNSRLREQTIVDPLTGVYNRRHFEDIVAHDAARADRLGEPLAVAMIDVDHFKQVNDRYGHAVGDRVLTALGALLRAGVRTSDLVCRWGGEEFVVLLPGAALPGALQRAEKWRVNFAEERFTDGDGQPVRCSISVGVAVFRVDEETIDATLRRADQALYEAKRQGRNLVVPAEGDLLRPDGGLCERERHKPESRRRPTDMPPEA
jgi:diguanylate cyclase (GGDEF)-like protein/PAS domain S-box-containing protein